MRELANPWHPEYQGRVVVLSLTTEAQRILGPGEYWDLPEVGAKVVANQPLIVVMAKWRYTDLTLPVNGTVVARNPRAVGWAERGATDWILRIECN
ncbi:glycine cleavage system protein H [Limosilactobacillus fermentum]